MNRPPLTLVCRDTEAKQAATGDVGGENRNSPARCDYDQEDGNQVGQEPLPVIHPGNLVARGHYDSAGI